MARDKEKILVTKIAPRRFLGVAEAAKRLRVRPQTIYMYVGGWEGALGPKKRERIEFVDLSGRVAAACPAQA